MVSAPTEGQEFRDVVEIGLTLPDVVEGTAYGSPALKFRGRMLAALPTNKSAESGSVVIRIATAHRSELIRTHPEIYYVTPHYEPHPSMLVRLSRLDREELERVLRLAWVGLSMA
jgi:hypothetical protein